MQIGNYPVLSHSLRTLGSFAGIRGRACRKLAFFVKARALGLNHHERCMVNNQFIGAYLESFLGFKYLATTYGSYKKVKRNGLFYVEINSVEKNQDI